MCGEGSFTYFTNTRVYAGGLIKMFYNMIFEVSQLPHDTLLLHAIAQLMGTGIVYTQLNAVSRMRIASLPQLQHIVIPFFTRYTLPGFKGIQYRA